MHGLLRPCGFPPLIGQFSDLPLADDQNFAENVLARLMRRGMRLQEGGKIRAIVEDL